MITNVYRDKLEYQIRCSLDRIINEIDLLFLIVDLPNVQMDFMKLPIMYLDYPLNFT